MMEPTDKCAFSKYITLYCNFTWRQGCWNERPDRCLHNLYVTSSNPPFVLGVKTAESYGRNKSSNSDEDTNTEYTDLDPVNLWRRPYPEHKS